MTGHRETRRDGFQVGRAIVGISSCGWSVRYQRCSMFCLTHQVMPGNHYRPQPTNNATDAPKSLATDKTAPVEHPYSFKRLRLNIERKNKTKLYLIA